MLDNPKWEKFCQLYAMDGNATAAYKGAGSKVKTDAAAASCAHKLLRIAQIQDRLTELVYNARMVEEQSAIADIREIRERVTTILRGTSPLETKASDVIKAGEFLAKLGGQVEPPTVRVELTLAQKRERLQEMKREVLNDFDD